MLGLDYRELLALTDQLGALEGLERQAAQPSDLAALVAELREQNALLRQLVAQQPTPMLVRDLIGEVVAAQMRPLHDALADLRATESTPASVIPAAPARR